MKIGIETEFMVNNYIPQRIVEHYKIQPEYYGGMFELNNFLQNFNTAKGIRRIFSTVRKQTKELENKIAADFSTNMIRVMHDTLVFTGTHIHISLDSVAETKKFYRWLTTNDYIIKYKLMASPSVRAIFSHHIWGKHRYSGYNFKRNIRYAPVIYTGFNTIELRIFDNEDILDKKNAHALSEFLIYLVYKFKKCEHRIKKPVNYSLDSYQGIVNNLKTVGAEDVRTLYNIAKKLNMVKDEKIHNTNNSKCIYILDEDENDIPRIYFA